MTITSAPGEALTVTRGASSTIKDPALDGLQYICRNRRQTTPATSGYRSARTSICEYPHVSGYGRTPTEMAEPIRMTGQQP